MRSFTCKVHKLFRQAKRSGFIIFKNEGKTAEDDTWIHLTLLEESRCKTHNLQQYTLSLLTSVVV